MWHTIHKNVKAGIECFDGLFSCAERKAITKTGEEVNIYSQFRSGFYTSIVISR